MQAGAKAPVFSQEEVRASIFNCFSCAVAKSGIWLLLTVQHYRSFNQKMNFFFLFVSCGCKSLRVVPSMTGKQGASVGYKSTPVSGCDGRDNFLFLLK